MAARRYEISLRVGVANEWNIFQHEERNFESPSDHVMFFLLYKHQWNTKPHFTLIAFYCERCNLSCSHSNGDLFTCEDNVLFSRVKILLTGWESFHQRNNSFREHNSLFSKHMQPSSVYTYNTAHAEHRWPLWYNDRIVSYQQYHVFGRNLTWYFIGVYTINTVELSLTFWILLNFKWRRGVHLLKKNFCKKLF